MKWNDIVYFSSAARAIKRTGIMSRFYEEFVFMEVLKLKIPGEQKWALSCPKDHVKADKGQAQLLNTVYTGVTGVDWVIALDLPLLPLLL